jgi:hypothetical protein
MLVTRLVVGYAALIGLLACHHDDGKPPPAEALDSNVTFVAFPETFQPFRSWTAFHDPGPPDGSFPAAVLGPRTQYINEIPPHGSTQFPVGTVIVEARESGQMLILGAVKRGGGYNLGGATNWEWFGLAEDPTSGAVSISWRGTMPPVMGYGGLPMEGCNDCHTACGLNNDFVCSPELQLAGF